MMVHAFSIQINGSSATISDTKNYANTVEYFMNPITDIKGYVSDQVHQGAESIYLGFKQLFVDFAHFIFVDLLGKVSLVAVILGCLAIILGSKRASWKLLKGGAIGTMISIVASLGWS